MLAGIAALLIFLPAVVQDAVAAWAGRSPAASGIGALVGLVAALLAIWGNLALVAAASDPVVDGQGALAIGARRLAPAIGLSVLVVVALALLSVPAVALLAASGLDPATLATGAASGAVVAAPGPLLGAGLYLLALLAATVWIGARLALFWPVVVNERCGTGSFARSFALTRRLTWRIVGVSILFVVLLLVALSAAQLVATLVVRLLAGADGATAAHFAGGVADAAVSAGGAAVSAAFVAQLYRVVSGREAAHALA
jgi:hypothetical protein